eukprot:scaffold28068_cov81-Phaeocystis_antarctica.AAC.1
MSKQEAVLSHFASTGCERQSYRAGGMGQSRSAHRTTRACQNTPVVGRARTSREGVGGRRSGHLLLAEGRATGNYRMYDHSVAQAATDVFLH